MNTDLCGVGHIMITPFDADERVDEAGLRRVADAAVQAGCTAVIPLGIMGEAHALLDAERDAVLAATVEAVAGRAGVVAGCSGDSTYVAVHRVRAARRLGADAVMVAPPRGIRPGPAVVEHYRAVAEASELPVVVQDEPVTTGVTLSAELIGRLLELPRVAYVKVEEVPSPGKIGRIRAVTPDARCFGGLGGVSFFEELGRGAVGTFTGFGFPRLLVEIVDAYAAGEPERAREVFYRYLPLIRFEAQLGIGGVAIRKQVFAERGLIAHPGVRRPAGGVDERTLQELRELIAYLGL